VIPHVTDVLQELIYVLVVQLPMFMMMKVKAVYQDVKKDFIKMMVSVQHVFRMVASTAHHLTAVYLVVCRCIILMASVYLNVHLIITAIMEINANNVIQPVNLVIV